MVSAARRYPKTLQSRRTCFFFVLKSMSSMLLFVSLPCSTSLDPLSFSEVRVGTLRLGYIESSAIWMVPVVFWLTGDITRLQDSAVSNPDQFGEYTTGQNSAEGSRREQKEIGAGGLPREGNLLARVSSGDLCCFGSQSRCGLRRITQHLTIYEELRDSESKTLDRGRLGKKSVILATPGSKRVLSSMPDSRRLKSLISGSTCRGRDGGM
jgi:hypothetical protein